MVGLLLAVVLARAGSPPAACIELPVGSGPSVVYAAEELRAWTDHVRWHSVPGEHDLSIANWRHYMDAMDAMEL